MTRRYDASPEEVWRLLTDPASLGRWLAPTRTVEMSHGGTLEFALPDGTCFGGRIQEFDPPRLLELDWTYPGEEGPSLVRFSLEGDGGSTRLVLEHLRVDALRGMAAMGRWEEALHR